MGRALDLAVWLGGWVRGADGAEVAADNSKFEMIFWKQPLVRDITLLVAQPVRFPSSFTVIGFCRLKGVCSIARYRVASDWSLSTLR